MSLESILKMISNYNGLNLEYLSQEVSITSSEIHLKLHLLFILSRFSLRINKANRQI